MQLEDWLDDLCVRFIVNLPPEELESVERICFQVEEAQWFYEDFIRPLDPSLPSLPLRAFSLRIFQHCPLFSQWSAEHYTTAFAEFMAYKSRVPVRGAILLNDAMDECVLVKGWKKGANWSFPRGKINKDENDLDCAVREVYEETGFDLQAAGLVHDEKDMKYIEQTMREQHMKLFVFKGVPKSTHFEPRTRKEISKIEWYKLTDLPTLKKHKHHDSNGGEHAGMNANKFYMVAPFLAQLKKWIAQQRKKESRHSSNLAAPPLVADESEIESGVDLKYVDHPLQIPSDLPEVTVSRSQDPTAHLKQLFNIGIPQQPQSAAQPAPQNHMPQVDAVKSKSLLALLRGGPSTELQAGPHTPVDQTFFPPEMPRLSHHPYVRPAPQVHQPPAQFHVQSELPTSPIPRRPFPEPAWQNPQQMPSRGPPPGLSTFGLAPPLRAPYQQTGDPDFARPRPPSQAIPVIPPASALPKLTNHAKTLLDVFKGTSPSPGPPPPQPTAAKQSLLDLFKQTDAAPTATVPTTGTQGQQVSPLSSQGPESATLAATAPAAPHPANAHQKNLLGLFSQPPSVLEGPLAESTNKPAAELSATPDQQHRASQQKPDILQALLKQKRTERAVHKTPPSLVKEGETAATISGPLNQPNFDAISRVHKETPESIGRAPLTTHRTLYDPNHPVPVKIMARPETPKQTPSKSPRPPKAKVATSSPKRGAKSGTKESSKPFQPQILRRPQTREGESSTKGPEPAQPPTSAGIAILDSASMSREVSSEKEPPAAERKLSQADAHKQTLLSLLGGGSPSAPKTVQTPSRVVSPLSMSQLISPREEVPISAVEPKLAGSRMGSVSSSTGNTTIRPGLEKRQTGAENKAFLLGFLGRMATQEG